MGNDSSKNSKKDKEKKVASGYPTQGNEHTTYAFSYLRNFHYIETAKFLLPINVRVKSKVKCQ